MKVTRFPFFTSPLLLFIFGTLILLTTSQLNPPGYAMENNPSEQIVEVITFIPDDLNELCLQIPHNFRGREVRIKLTAPRFDHEDIYPNHPIHSDIVYNDDVINFMDGIADIVDDMVDRAEEIDDNDVNMVDHEE